MLSGARVVASRREERAELFVRYGAAAHMATRNRIRGLFHLDEDELMLVVVVVVLWSEPAIMSLESESLPPTPSLTLPYEIREYASSFFWVMVTGLIINMLFA